MEKNVPKTLLPYSVAMSVYDKENAHYLKQSIESILNQTHRTNDFVIICDGKLTPELYQVLKSAKDKYGDVIRIVQPKEKLGTSGCANLSLRLCRNELIGKMDSDDIALPERFEYQVRRMMLHPELDIIGSFIEEFSSETGEAIATRKVPLSSKAVLKFAKRRSPFNNQTMLFKKSVALACGGYDTKLVRCEDYDFITRMLQSGAVGGNIPKVLLRYRVTEGNLERRRNLANTKAFIKVRWNMHRRGFSSLSDFIIPSVMQVLLFALPSKLTGILYKKLMR